MRNPVEINDPVIEADPRKLESLRDFVNSCQGDFFVGPIGLKYELKKQRVEQLDPPAQAVVESLLKEFTFVAKGAGMHEQVQAKNHNIRQELIKIFRAEEPADDALLVELYERAFKGYVFQIMNDLQPGHDNVRRSLLARGEFETLARNEAGLTDEAIDHRRANLVRNIREWHREHSPEQASGKGR